MLLPWPKVSKWMGARISSMGVGGEWVGGGESGHWWTMNKAQGQTLDFVGIYLPQDVFTYGQLYVALSRSTQFYMSHCPYK